MAGLKRQMLASRSLDREEPFYLHVPDGPAPAAGWPLVVVLHGDGRHCGTLAEDPLTAQLVRRMPCAVLCPEGKRDWWIDAPGRRRRSYVLEAVQTARRQHGVAPQAELTAVVGWSMGGFGAMRFIQEYPHETRIVGTLMGLLDFPNPDLPPHQNYPVPDLLSDPQTAFRENPLSGAVLLRGASILQLAPSEAFDLAMNRSFHARLSELGIVHEYSEIPGGHDWDTVRSQLGRLLAFAVGHF